jgi:hypothetical protein
MATTDHIHPGYPAWTPSATGVATANGQYVGRHRKSETWRRFLSIFRLFYVGRHRAR